MPFIYFLTCLLLLFQSSSASALTTFKANYNISFGFVNLGEAEMRLTHTTANNYTLGFYAETSGFTAFVYPYSLKEESHLQRMQNNMLRSTGYFYEERKKRDIKKQYKVDIDYDTKKITSIGLKKTKQWQLNTHLATDKLSFAFIIGDDIEQGKKLRSPITIIDGKKIRYLTVKELTDIPFNYNTNQETPFKREDYQSYRRFFLEDDGENMEIWLAKKHNHIPYKILFTSDGWTLYYELKKIQSLR